jgi:5'-3' exonuclease
LEDLFIRQAEVDTIEADDLIAYYILNRRPDEEIIINSRDGDFYQLIAPNVSMLTPDKYKIVTSNNFKETFGYTRENALLFK